MATEIKMPQLSDTMDAGKILAWKKNEGEAVKRGDILAEVETDKANLEIECFQEGTLLKVVVPTGQTAKVGEIIAVIGQAGESAGAPAPQNRPAAAPQPAAQPAKPQPAPIHAGAPAPVPVAHGADERIKVSPLARKIAQQKNIDLSIIQGSGPQGRIIKKDLDSAPAPRMTAPGAVQPAARRESAPAPRAASSAQPLSGSLTPFSKMRETIARRMVESVTQAPHFYTTTSVRMDEALRLRELLKTKPEYQGISVNHLVIKAVAYGIQHEPRVNRAVRDDQIYEPAQINVGIITAIEDGLLIPVIRETNTLSLKDVVFEARAAVERARAGRPNSTDLSGGTFSISNMGMYDVESFTAIINPGQGSVLAVSSVKEQPVVENGAVVVGSVMKATISVDHRIIDGVMASTFLKYFKEALETPALLMV